MTTMHARFLKRGLHQWWNRARRHIYLPTETPRRREILIKLKWMGGLIHYARERLALEEPLVVAGDYNVIPTAADVRNPAAWLGDALYLPRPGKSSARCAI
jgi:exodeoxyribonuclease-3